MSLSVTSIAFGYARRAVENALAAPPSPPHLKHLVTLGKPSSLAAPRLLFCVAGTAAGWTAESVGIQLELQFDLCAEDPQQLMRIVDVYSAVKVNAIKTEMRRAMNKVRERALLERVLVGW